MSIVDMSFTKDLATNPNAGYSEGYDNSPLPEGEYAFVIEKCEEVACAGGEMSLKPEVVQKHLAETGADPGWVWKMTAKIVEGPHEGRKVFWGKMEFMFVAPSDEPTKEGRNARGPWKITPAGSVANSKENFAGLMRACGITRADEPGDMIGCTGVARCTIQPNGKYNKWFFKPQKEGVKKPTNVGTTPVAVLNEDIF